VRQERQEALAPLALVASGAPQQPPAGSLVARHRRRSYMRSKIIGLAAALGVLATVLATPATGEESSPRATAANEIVFSVSTAELNASTFKSPWQIAWIPSGTKTGAIAFTDRGGNQVGILDPANLRTQNVRLNNITAPGPIAVIDNTRFAVAGTGGAAIFDRSGAGRVTELVMPNTRNQALAIGPDLSLFVADAQQHDLRIIAPPYSGPVDIRRLPIPQQCRNPTGLIPGTTTIDILCQQTNNIVRIDYTGNFGSATFIPVANAGAQEARPSPTGFVFSGFNANLFFSFSGSNRQFKSFAHTGPAVPTVGLFHDPASDRKLAEAAARLRTGRKPARAFFFNSFTPSFRDGSFSFGSFPAGSSSAFTRLAGRNLVGSTNGPGGSIWVADATPGRPALHRINLGDGTKTGRTRTGYRFSKWFTKPGPDFLARMSMPFTGPVPTDVRVSVTGASASPWNLKPTFTENFGLKAIVRGSLPGAGSYQVKVASADSGPYTRVYQFGLRPGTRSATLTLTGGGTIPASFKVDAVAEVGPCECDSLDVLLRTGDNPEGFGSESGTIVPLEWTLECTGGPGRCKGAFSIKGDQAARAADIKLGHGEGLSSYQLVPADREFDVRCDGDCTAPTTETRYLTVRPPDGSRLGRDVRSVTIVVERTCGRQLAPKIFRIAFGAAGVVSARRSDLNGNGVADGKEKR
jgi:hypothetical protein